MNALNKVTKKISSANALVAFLILETIAVTSFALGGVNSVFYVIGIIIGLSALFITYERFSKNEIKSLAIFMGTMFLVSVFSSFGNLYRDAFGLSNLIVVLAINFFLFLGIASRRINGFKPETLLLTIGVSLGLLTLISMIFSWTQYGFFYAVRYSNTPIYYYNAELFDVTKEGFWLQGFAFKETTLSTTGMFGIICSCYLAGLIFFKPRENKIAFFLCLAIGIIGLIYLITIPNIIALCFLIPGLVVAFLYKLLKGRKNVSKVISIIFVVILSLALLFFIFACVNAKGNNGFATFIASNAFLNRIFNGNRIMYNANLILKVITNDVGCFFLGVKNIVAYSDAVCVNSKMLPFEILKEGGMIAFLAFVGFVTFTFFSIRKYLRSSNDSDGVKIVLLVILVSFIVYEMFECNIYPNALKKNEYIPFLRSPLMLTILFIVGYVYTPLFIKEGETYGKEIVNEENKHNVEIIDKDYEFKDEEEA